MLLGVLRMSYEMAMEDEFFRRQCWSRAAEAADRIEADAEKIAEMEAEVDRLKEALSLPENERLEFLRDRGDGKSTSEVLDELRKRIAELEEEVNGRSLTLEDSK